MAYIPNQNKKEDQTSPSGQSSGQGAGVLSSSGTSSAPGQNKKQNFATLQSYLKTNKPQGEQFAGKLAEGVAQTGQQAQQGIDTTKQNLTSNVQANTLNYDPNIVKEATTNPTQFVQDPDKLKTFTDYRTANYGGPASAESTPEYQKAQSDTALALERSKLVDTEGGRKQLASEAQKSRAGGITALNQALLSTNPNAAATLQAAKVPFANLQTSLGATAEQINAQIKAAQDAATQASTETEQALTNKLSEFNTDLQQRVQTAADNRTLSNQQGQAINQKIMDGETLSSEELTKLGVDPTAYKKVEDLYAQMKSLYGDKAEGRTPTTYYTPGVMNPNIPQAGTVATPEDYSTEAGLEALTGEQLGILQNDQSGQAGTYKDASGLGKYDTNKQFAGVKSAYEQADANYLRQFLDPNMAQYVNTNDIYQVAKMIKAGVTRGDQRQNKQAQDAADRILKQSY